MDYKQNSRASINRKSAFYIACFSLLLAGCGGGEDNSAPDTLPDNFSFLLSANNDPSAEVLSESVVISGVDLAVPISIEGGEYSIEGQAFTSESSTISPGDSVQIKALTSSDFESSTTVVLTVGELTEEFIVSVRSADTTPDNFDIEDVSTTQLESYYEFPEFVVTGIEGEVDITVAENASYSINGGDFLTSPGLVSQDDEVVVRLASSDASQESISSSITVGGVTESFTLTIVEPAGDILIQAEEMELLGAASANAEYVENVANIGDGTRVSSPRQSEALTLRYFAAEDGTISILRNGEEFSTFYFNETGEDILVESNWKIVSVNKAVSEGDVIDVVYSENDAPIYLDYLEFHKNKIASIRTIAQTQGGVDGINLTPTGDVLLGGSYPIRSISQEGVETTLPESSLSTGNPLGMDFNSEGVLFSANFWENSIEMYSTNGDSEIFVAGSEISGPNDVVVLSNDDLVVANCSDGNIVRVSSEGLILETIELVSTGGWDCIAGLARDENDNIYVSYWNVGSIYRVSPDNAVTLLAEYLPSSVNHITYQNGFLYAPDSRASMIRKLGPNGETTNIGREKPRLIDGDIRTANIVRSNGIVAGNDGESLYFNDQINDVEYIRTIEYVEHVPQSPDQIETDVAEITISFEVQVPENTPQDAPIYITGDFEVPTGWSGGTTMNPEYTLLPNENGLYELDLTLPTDSYISFKFTLGSWNVEEVNADGSRRGDRGYLFIPGESQAQLTIDRWKALP